MGPKPFDDEPHALLAAGPEELQALGQGLGAPVDAVAQDVDAVLGPGVDLDAAEDFLPYLEPLLLGLGVARDRVVVAEHQELDAALLRPADDLGGRGGAVGIGTVGVQVDAPAHRRSAGGREKRRSTREPTQGSSPCRCSRVTLSR